MSVRNGYNTAPNLEFLEALSADAGVYGASYYVDPLNGSDGNDGA